MLKPCVHLSSENITNARLTLKIYNISLTVTRHPPCTIEIRIVAEDGEIDVDRWDALFHLANAEDWYATISKA